MGWLEDVWEAVKDGASKVADWIGAQTKDVWEWIRRRGRKFLGLLLVLSSLGLIAHFIFFLWTALFNNNGRPLDPREKALLRAFFSDNDVPIDTLRIHENATLLAPKDKTAMCVGNRIYWEGQLDICPSDDGYGDRQARVLVHEVVHARQFYEGGFWEVDYISAYLLEWVIGLFAGGNAMEAEADTFVSLRREDIHSRRELVCRADRDSLLAASPEAWDWILLG